MKTDVRSHPIHRSRPGRIAIAAAAIGLSFCIASPALADDSNDRPTRFPETITLPNDAVAGDTAYFTDSQRAVIYALPVHGDAVGEPREIPLGGDFVLAPPGSFNGNGIAAIDDDTLVLGQSTDPDGSGSALYLVDASSGVATRITITGGDVTAADGLLLKGRTLYVVQNRENSIAQLRLSPDGTEARYVRTLTDPDFDVPTTIDFGPYGDLYAVNARFGTTGTDAVPYKIVRVQR